MIGIVPGRGRIDGNATRTGILPSSIVAQPSTPNYRCTMAHAPRRTTTGDIHTIATGLPYVTGAGTPVDRPVYQVGSKSFVFVRTPTPGRRRP